MRKRVATGLVVVIAGLSVLLDSAASTLVAQDKSKIAPPKHLYGYKLGVRKGGVRDFDKNTPRVGVEFFHDEATQAIIAISEIGAIAVAKAPLATFGDDKICEWKTGHDLHCRKAGEAEFTQSTKKWGVEMFYDRGTNQLLYVCESMDIALAPVPGGLVTDRGPKWHHALEPKVRAPEMVEFTNAKKFGVEIFKDENTNGLIYITETGAIATAPTSMPFADPKKIAAPKAVYGLDLRVRGAEELNFTEKTKRWGVEVFLDPNAGTQFYLSEAGYISAVPQKGEFVPGAIGVTWRSAMALRARKGDETDFDTAKKYGIEVFEDNRTGNLLFISETGSIAILPKKIGKN